MNSSARAFNRLFILSYGAIGDFCVLLYFLEHLHRGLPGMQLEVLATRNEKLLREMSAAHPYVRITGIRSPSLLVLFIRSFYERNAFVVPPTFFDVPAFASFLARAFTLRGRSIGFESKARTPRYDIVLPFEKRDQFYKNFWPLLGFFGLPLGGPFRLTFIKDESPVASLGRGYIVLAPFASNPSKSLPPERWIDLLGFLGRSYPDRTAVVLGAPGDAATAEKWAFRSGHPSAKVMCGLPFAQTAAIIAHTKCFIGVDSGLTHVAGVQEVPTVAIENLRTIMWLPRYNPKAVILTEPKNCVCDGEHGRDCFWVIDGVQYSRCVADIPQERIERAIKEMLMTYA
jgi:ADP-heptose:LPS heptosyltransferase